MRFCHHSWLVLGRLGGWGDTLVEETPLRRSHCHLILTRVKNCDANGGGWTPTSRDATWPLLVETTSDKLSFNDHLQEISNPNYFLDYMRSRNYLAWR